MNNKLTVSFIGAGNIAGGFDEKKFDQNEGIFSHALAYKKHGGFILENVFDPNTQRAREFKEYWDVKHVQNNESDIIKNFQDVISICSPDPFHFETIKAILHNKSCQTVFIEKPLGLSIEEIKEIDTYAQQSDIKIVVNFQRRFDDSYKYVITSNLEILSINSLYVKGLNHIGITMIDTLCMLFHQPLAVYTYNSIYNETVNDFTYEFILFYQKFNITVKSIDVTNKYHYHTFDIDIHTNKNRLYFTDNGNTLIKYPIENYYYKDVKVLSSQPVFHSTNYKKSMLESIHYLYDISLLKRKHTINTVASSYNNHIIVEKIKESFEHDKKITLEESLWKE